MTASLRNAIEHEPKVRRSDGDAIKAAVGALFGEPCSAPPGDAKHGRPPAS